MKKQAKIKNQTLMVDLEFPIEVGQVKMDAVCQVFIRKNEESGKLEGDFEFIDYNNTTYMGMPVNGYEGVRKLKAFHLELGINLDTLLSDKFEEFVDYEFQTEFLSRYNINMFEI